MGALALLVPWTGLVSAQEVEVKSPHITVSGTASEDAMPDLAVLSLGSTDENAVAATAVAENAKHAQAIVAELRAQNIDPADIRTVEASLSPTMEDRPDPKNPNSTRRILAGYRASITFAVTIRQLDKVGAIVSRMVEHGANDYRGLAFLVSDEEARYDKLRGKAVANAMHRAGLYAQGASMRLGRLLAINPEPDRLDEGRADLYLKAMRAAPAAVPLPVEPGTRELTIRVAATWELVPN